MSQEKFGPRQINRNMIKDIIDIVRARPKRTMEIVNELLKTKKYSYKDNDHLRRVVNRILSRYLEFWGLIEKIEDRWVWKDYLYYMSEDDYKVYHDHSMTLLNNFFKRITTKDPGKFLSEMLLNINKPQIHNQLLRYLTVEEEYQTTIFPELKFIIEHIKSGYPSLYDDIIDYREISKEYSSLITKKMIEEYSKVREKRKIKLKPLEEIIEDYQGKINFDQCEGYYIQRILKYHLYYNDFDKLLSFVIKDTYDIDKKQSIEDTVIMALDKYFGSDLWSRIIQLRESYYQKLRSIIDSLLTIYYRVLSGDVLKGRCSVCPPRIRKC